MFKRVKEKRKKRKKTFAFTLIEVLIALAIIGALGSFAYANYRSSLRRTRNTQRQSDLAQYRLVLENYAAGNNGIYPLGIFNPGNPQAGHGESCTNSGIFEGVAPLGDGGPLIPTYLPAKIPDPKEGAPPLCKGPCAVGVGDQCTYRYRAYDNGQKYFLLTNLEPDGYWIVCSDGRSGRTTTWCDPGVGPDSYVDQTCDLLSGQPASCAPPPPPS